MEEISLGDFVEGEGGRPGGKSGDFAWEGEK